MHLKLSVIVISFEINLGSDTYTEPTVIIPAIWGFFSSFESVLDLFTSHIPCMTM
jgi:hypothetical protein